MRADVAGRLPPAAAALAGGDHPLPRRPPAAARTSPTSCARARSTPEERAGLDLSRWEVAFNGAEPVRPATLRALRGGVRPLRLPAHGVLPLLRPRRGDAVRRRRRPAGRAARRVVRRRGARARARRGRRRPAPPPASSPRCGQPWLGQELAIVDPETRRQAPGGRGRRDLGRAARASPAGYWGRPEETAETFGAGRRGRLRALPAHRRPRLPARTASCSSPAGSRT